MPRELQVKPPGHAAPPTLQYFKHCVVPALKHPYVAAQSASVVHTEPCVPLPESPQRVKSRIWPMDSCANPQAVPETGQPVFVEGSQFSVHSVTPGICPLEPSFNVMRHKPPGAVQFESVEQYFMHVEIVSVVLTHKLPGTHSLPVQDPPIGVLPAATQTRVP